MYPCWSSCALASSEVRSSSPSSARGSPSTSWPSSASPGPPDAQSACSQVKRAAWRRGTTELDQVLLVAGEARRLVARRPAVHLVEEGGALAIVLHDVV